MQKRKFFTGWHTSVLAWLCTAIAILILNFVLTVWAMLSFKSHNGMVVVYQGSCATTKTWNMMLHLLINVLSTLLLGASNYCMQCLSAPTRVEVNNAHSKNKWLDIGVQSLRNLLVIRKKRVILWCLLGVSSIPLHLFFNSTVHESLAANECQIKVVSDAFLQGGTWNWNSISPKGTGITTIIPKNQTIADMQKLYQEGALEKLSKTDCMKAYGTQLVTNRRNVLAVSTNVTSSTESVSWVYVSPIIENYYWICYDLPFEYGARCDLNTALNTTP